MSGERLGVFAPKANKPVLGVAAAGLAAAGVLFDSSCARLKRFAPDAAAVVCFLGCADSQAGLLGPAPPVICALRVV